eukprot:TRINITY_DN473_c0_g1_i1.p2 TRINITY_DN473_c0_g1~~TRINITY_DN473_c0_g1_i1.p2  ORF type:complete len:160 (-),score=11.31 TRINITY_DN473_c0_g1_i1:317-796(-)
MPCYFGCATTSNKIRYGVFGGLLALGVVFVVVMHVLRAQHLKEYKDCVEDLEEEGKITSYQKDSALNYKWNIYGGYYEYRYLFAPDEDIQKCAEKSEEDNGLIVTFFILCIVFFIGASIPCFTMCCCSEPPSSFSVRQYQMAQVATPYSTATYGGAYKV